MFTDSDTLVPTTKNNAQYSTGLCDDKLQIEFLVFCEMTQSLKGLCFMDKALLPVIGITNGTESRFAQCNNVVYASSLKTLMLCIDYNDEISELLKKSSGINIEIIDYWSMGKVVEQRYSILIKILD